MRISHWTARVALLPAMCVAVSCGRPDRASRADEVPRALVRQYPCPAPVPAAWTAADSSLGRAPRCALVAAAVAAVRAGAHEDSTLADIRLARVACVRLHRVQFRDPSTEAVVTDHWSVEFYSDEQPDVVATVHPATGAARAVVAPREFGYSIRELCARAT